MAYTIPPYLIDQDIGDSNLQYVWDDTRTSEDFEYNGDWIVDRMKGVHLTGQIALGIGMYEWIVWRFQPLTSDLEPRQLAEAAWCATVHPAYIEFASFDRHQWRGPIRGPLWCAQTWLVPMARSDLENPEECEDGLEYLYSLAMHVLPTTTAFESWLNGCIERITDLYAAPKEDPFSNLFSDPVERRGPLVAPALLDLSKPFVPSQARSYMSRFLAAVQHSANPFLVSPQEMLDEGFSGTPYEIRDTEVD